MKCEEVQTGRKQGEYLSGKREERGHTQLVTMKI